MIHHLAFLAAVLAASFASSSAAIEASPSSCPATSHNGTDKIPGIRDLVNFVHSHGGDASAVYFKTGPEGRGVFAAQNVSEGNTLFRLPRSTIFSPHLTSKMSILKRTPECQEILDHPNDEFAAALLLYIETAKRYSEFEPYFAVLPRDLPPTIYSFTDEEIRMCADVDGMERETALARQLVAEAYDNVTRCTDSVRDDLVNVDVDMDKLTVEHLRWSLGMIKSRSIGVIFADGSGGRSLIPLVDMLNHQHCDKAPMLQWEVHDTHVTIKAPRNYTEGEQVYECYGNIKNADLVKSFGFTLDHCDRVDVPVSFAGANYSYAITSDSIEAAALLETWNEAAAALNASSPEMRRFRRFNAALLEGFRARRYHSEAAGSMGDEKDEIVPGSNQRLAHLQASCSHIRTCNMEILTKAEASLVAIDGKVAQMYERCG